jgi:nitrate reductase delta subunit
MNEQQQSSQQVPPAAWNLGAAYRVIAELLLNPEFRDGERVALDLARLQGSALGEQIELFLEEPGAHDIGEYTQTLELAPPVPLYLGAYMYEEPSSCRGAGASGRNAFMIEIAAIYEHFGVSMGDSELPDFAPVVIEFLALSLSYPDRDGIGLRRRLVEKYVQPGLPALRKALKKYESVYDRLIESLEVALNEDLERMADDPIWLAPDVKNTIPQRVTTSPSLDAARHGGQQP